MKLRFFYGPSRLGAGPALFFGAFVLVLLTSMAIALWKQDEASLLLLLLILLMAGYVVRHGCEFFSRRS